MNPKLEALLKLEDQIKGAFEYEEKYRVVSSSLSALETLEIVNEMIQEIKRAYECES